MNLFEVLASEVAKKYVPFPYNIVLEWLIEEVSKQENELKKIEQDLETLKIAPFFSGKIHLEEAQRFSDKERALESIDNARKAFIDALPQVNNLRNYPYLPAYTRFYIGVCHALLSESENALYWFREAQDSAIKIQVNRDIEAKGTPFLIKVSKGIFRRKTRQEKEFDVFYFNLTSLLEGRKYFLPSAK